MIATTLVRDARRTACLLLAATWLLACAPLPAGSVAPPATSPTPVSAKPAGSAAQATPSAEVAAPAPSPTPASSQPTVSAAPLATPPGASEPPPALTLWVAEDEPALLAVRDLAERFAEDAGVALEVVARPPDGLRLSLATAELTGDPLPDLLWADGETLAGLIVDGRIQPLASDLLPPDTLPALRTAATAEGATWGMPVAAHGALLLLHNRALAPGPPATSDALIVAARAAESAEVAGLVMAWDEARWLLPWLHAFGGAPTSLDGLTVTLDTPAMTPTLNLLRELYTASDPDGDGYGRGRRIFAQGYAAYAIDGDWSLEAYRAVSDTLDLGIAPLPVVPATDRPAAPVLGGTYLMLARELEDEGLDQGRAFAAYLAEPANQLRLAEALGRLPATTGALSSAKGPWATDPALAGAAALAAAAPGLPPTAAARCALYGIDVWLPSLYRGVIPAADLPARMQREAEACLVRSG